MNMEGTHHCQAGCMVLGRRPPNAWCNHAPSPTARAAVVARAGTTMLAGATVILAAGVDRR